MPVIKESYVRVLIMDEVIMNLLTKLLKQFKLVLFKIIRIVLKSVQYSKKEGFYLILTPKSCFRLSFITFLIFAEMYASFPMS